MNHEAKYSFSYQYLTVEGNLEMLNESLEQIREFVRARGYQLIGELPGQQEMEDALHAISMTREKKLIKRHLRLKAKPGMRAANAFLHFLCRKCLEYGEERTVLRVDYSEKELAIKAARKAWVKARDAAEELRLAYVGEKGDFYKLPQGG